jgi:hypothetical protein
MAYRLGSSRGAPSAEARAFGRSVGKPKSKDTRKEECSGLWLGNGGNLVDYPVHGKFNPTRGIPGRDRDGSVVEIGEPWDSHGQLVIQQHIEGPRNSVKRERVPLCVNVGSKSAPP